MAKFVCPVCEAEMEGSEDDLVPEAKKHMSQEHDRRSVSNDFVDENIHSAA